MIELRNIKKKFDHVVLNKINLTLEESNIYVIKGVSGSGKTTLFNILSFLDADYEGEYFWDNNDVKKVNNSELTLMKDNVSYVFQKSFLFRKLTIKENLLFIKDDVEQIESYAKKFNIIDVLDKKPEQISGGEKQRVALVRSLLLNSKLIVLDEPTSSLDHSNALIFVNYLNELISANKIIVISTHKDIYDNVANRIYRIEDGKLNLCKDKLNFVRNNIIEEKKENKEWNFKYDYLFVRKRKKKRIMLTMVMILVFILLFFSFSIIQNLKREAINKYADEYPLHVINIREIDLADVEQKIIKTYKNYKLESANYNAYILFDEEDSYLNNDEVLSYGSFPVNENEVLVNEEYIKGVFSSIDYDSFVGKSIEIENNKLIICGIISGELAYYSNDIYREIKDYNTDLINPAIFIPYDKMQKISDYVSGNDIIITISKQDAINIYINDDVFKTKNNSYELIFSNMIRNKVFTIYNYVKIGLLISILLILFAFIFLVCKITLELYYRKKEIGFLQLYKVSKDRIHFLFLLDYFFEIIISIVFSIIIFNLIALIINSVYNMNFFISLFNWILIVFIIFVYFYALISIPVFRYLKMDILECINND